MSNRFLDYLNRNTASESDTSGNKDFSDYPQAMTRKKLSLENILSCIVIIIGVAMAYYAAKEFKNQLGEPGITTPEAAFCCIAFLAGALLIGIALAMVFSRAAEERKLQFNWYKDQLDDYLARKDRESNNTKAQ